MESDGEAAMVAVLESLVEEDPFHSSTMMLGDGASMADLLEGSEL